MADDVTAALGRHVLLPGCVRAVVDGGVAPSAGGGGGSGVALPFRQGELPFTCLVAYRQ